MHRKYQLSSPRVAYTWLEQLPRKSLSRAYFMCIVLARLWDGVLGASLKYSGGKEGRGLDPGRVAYKCFKGGVYCESQG